MYPVRTYNGGDSLEGQFYGWQITNIAANATMSLDSGTEFSPTTGAMSKKFRKIEFHGVATGVAAITMTLLSLPDETFLPAGNSTGLDSEQTQGTSPAGSGPVGNPLQDGGVVSVDVGSAVMRAILTDSGGVTMVGGQMKPGATYGVVNSDKCPVFIGGPAVGGATPSDTVYTGAFDANGRIQNRPAVHDFNSGGDNFFPGATAGSAISATTVGIPIVGSDGTNARVLRVDTSGDQYVIAMATNASSAVSGIAGAAPAAAYPNAQLTIGVGGKDNAGNLEVVATDTGGRVIVATALAAGTFQGGGAGAGLGTGKNYLTTATTTFLAFEYILITFFDAGHAGATSTWSLGCDILDDQANIITSLNVENTGNIGTGGGNQAILINGVAASSTLPTAGANFSSLTCGLPYQIRPYLNVKTATITSWSATPRYNFIQR